MTITIKPKNKKESEKIKTILKAIEVDFEEDVNEFRDETEYLNSTESNRNHLEKSLEAAEKGDFEKISIDSLWK
jgi:hypothetical protein